MPGPVRSAPKVADWIPTWMDPANASVFDSPVQSLLRQTIKVLGLDDPNQVMAFGTPLETGAGTGGLIDALASKFPKAAAAIRAFHGSPHDFEKFDVSKIGTGEGAQAYGHGLYFAEAEGTAKAYRQNLANGTYVSKAGMKDYGSLHGQMAEAAKLSAGLHPDQARQIANYVLDGIDVYGSPAAYLKEFEFPTGKFGDAYRAALKVAADIDIKPNPGKMYEVAIKAHPDQFLDWDKPLSQQSEHVQKAVKSLVSDVPEIHEAVGKASGEDVYRRLVPMVRDFGSRDPDQISSELKRAGVAGIKYLDQGSRNASLLHIEEAESLNGANRYWKVNGPQGDVSFDTKAAAQAFVDSHQQSATRNYVIFDDATVEILRKYGILPPLAGSALYGQHDPKQ